MSAMPARPYAPPPPVGTVGRLWARYGGADPLPVPQRWSAVLDVQLAHRSVRAYRPDPVPDGVLTTLVAAAQSAATSADPQLWSVVAVRDAGRRARLAALAGGQRHVEQAPLLLVWLADQGEADLRERALVDAAVAAQNAALAAESLGLGTVYIGTLRERADEVAAELGLPPHVVAAFGLAVGWPDPSGGESVTPRPPQDVVLHRERYDSVGQQWWAGR